MGKASKRAFDSVKDPSSRQVFYQNISLGMFMLGILLILVSILPVHWSASESAWTQEDSDAYQRLSREYKLSAYKTAAEMGLQPAEHQRQLQQLKSSVEAMRDKLAGARNRGEFWQRTMWWSGLLSLAMAGVAYSFGTTRAN